MPKLQKPLIKILNIFTAVLCGLSLLFLQFSFVTDMSLFNSGYHKWLFEKNKIHEETYRVINKSVTGFLSDLETNSPKNYEQHNEIFGLLKNSMTRELVYKNLDILRSGLFDYFSGKQQFLPDLNLDSLKKETADQKASAQVKALGQIEKVNLNAILMYINRTDINDWLNLIRLVYVFFNKLTGFSLLLVFLLFLAGLSLSKKSEDMLNWISAAFTVCAAAGLLLFFSAFAYTYVIIPRVVYPIAMSLPLPKVVLMTYIRGSLAPLLIFLAFVGPLCILTRFALKKAVRKLALVQKQPIPEIPAAENKKRLLIKAIVYSAVFLLAIASIGYRVYNFRQELNENKMAEALGKLGKSYEVTKVIRARDAAVYALEVRLKDRSTGHPATDTFISVNGISTLTGKAYSTNLNTDNDGKARCSLDKGTYRLGFIPEFFPAGLEMPSPFHIELKSPGTTVVTINLEKPKFSKTSKGIAEIEILNDRNIPIQGLELLVKSETHIEDEPDKVYSVSNQDGIAVFKLNEGMYTVSFEKDSLPSRYKMPDDFEIAIKADITSRYTLRLTN